jgi:hypothetical protein
MFESALDAELVTTIAAQTRAAAAADARRLAAIAELVSRRLDFDDDEREHWACDFWDAVAAEVAAAMGIGRRAASRHMQIGLALRARLPRIAALYADGLISSRSVSEITWRTRLVDSPAALTQIDEDLAERAQSFGPLSDSRLQHSIDQVVDRHDPGALIRTQIAARSRDVRFGDRDDATGTTSLWGRLLPTDAALLQKRLAEMAGQVCDDDPRTIGQRRADALGVLGAGATVLPCQCGKPTCPAAAVEDARAASVVVHVIAESAALDASPDPAMHGEYGARGDIGIDMPPQEARPAPAEPAAKPGPEWPATSDPAAEKPAPAAPSPKRRPAALIVGGGIVPAPLLAELLHRGARLQPIRPPGERPDPRYRPSPALADFVRMRDMTCRFPGCSRPAEYADLDHTTPHPAGPTHASNLKALCRHHHLVKTFWAGTHGWSDRQHPDGTVVWTAPTGHTYTTYPGSRLLFPTWNTESPPLAMQSVATNRPQTGRGAMMPRRRRTRAQDRAQRRKAERALNDAYVARRNKPPPM